MCFLIFFYVFLYFFNDLMNNVCFLLFYFFRFFVIVYGLRIFIGAFFVVVVVVVVVDDCVNCGWGGVGDFYCVDVDCGVGVGVCGDWVGWRVGVRRATSRRERSKRARRSLVG